jgi:aquaporin Z
MMEIVLTAILVSVSPISGASMNPARTLGPDIVASDYTGWWIYILGPLIGAIIAVAIIGVVRGLPDKQEREAAQGGALPMQDTSTPVASRQEAA